MSPAEDAPDDYAWPDHPPPAPGCLDCANLATRRRHARARGDGTSATDANVLMRQHLRLAHKTAG